MSKKNIDIDMSNLDTDKLTSGLNEKQQRIIEASERLFGERGFAQTATADIAKEAGVTERTLFKHFSSKAELFKQVLLPILLRFVAPAQFKEIRLLTEADYECYEDFLLAFFDNRARALRVHHSKVKILLQELVVNEKFRKQFSELVLHHILRPMNAMVLRMQQQGKIRSDIHPEVVVRSQVSSVLTYFLVRYVIESKTEGLEENEELKQMASVLAKGIAP